MQFSNVKTPEIFKFSEFLRLLATAQAGSLNNEMEQATTRVK
jgi:hypothetical protein